MDKPLSLAPLLQNAFYGLTLSSAQQTLLKWLALLLMVLDHANPILWSFQPWSFFRGQVIG